MPFNTRLNMSSVGVGLPRKQFGTRLFGGQEDLRGSDVGPQTGTLPFMSSSQPEVQTPTKNKDDSGDGLDWFSLLAPVISTGLGYLAGGKTGALYGASFGANAGASFVETKEERKRYREKMSQEQQKIGIQETEAATRSVNAGSLTTDRQDRLTENEIKNAVKTRVIQKGKFTPEVEAQIKASIEDEEEKAITDEIENAIQHGRPEDFDGIKARIQSNEWISGKTAQSLLARAESGKAGQLKKIETERGDKEFTKQNQSQELEIKRLTQESLIAQRDMLNAQKTQEMLRNAVEVNDWDTYVLINPSAKRESFDELRDNRIREQALTWDLRNPKIDPATGAKVARTPDEIDNIARSLGAGRSKPAGVGYDDAKVTAAVSTYKSSGETNDAIRKDLEAETRFTPQEKAEIARRLGFSVISDKSLDSDIDSLPR